MLQAFDRQSADDANVRLIRRAWECIGRKDIEGFVALLADDVVWTIPEMAHVPFAGVWHGPEGVKAFFKTVDAAQEVIAFEPTEVVAENDTVLVLGRFANRVKATGRIARSTWAQVWKVRQGKIASMTEFVDTQAVIGAYRPERDRVS